MAEPLPQKRIANTKILVLTVLMAITAAALGVALPSHGLLHSNLPIGTTLVTIVVLTVGFALTEMLVANFADKSGSHSFSLSEFPLAIGILVLAPRVTMFAAATGLGLVLSIHRRVPLLRLAFNISQSALSSSVGLIIATRLAPGVSEPGLRGWTVTLLAVVASASVGSVAVDLALVISDGRAHTRDMFESLLFGCAYAAASASLAVLVVWAARVDLSVLVLILPPVAITFTSLRNAIHEREKRGELEFLYNALQAMNDQRGTEFGLAAIARSLRTALRAEETTICLRTSDGWLLLQEDPPALLALLGEPVMPGQSVRSELGAERAFVRRRVDGSEGPLALIDVQNKALGRTGFSDLDLHMLDSLADQLGVHLENSGLSRTLAQLATAEKKLRSQLQTDTLTGLANRTWLYMHSAEKLPTAVVLIDLDGFKNVNDTLGHDAGDRVLSTYGENLVALSPPGWVPVRLGGDEFAMVRVLTDTPTRGEIEDLLVMIETQSVPPSLVASLGVPVGASAGGAARTRDSDDLDELLRRADTAMYAAKRARKEANAGLCGRVDSPRLAVAAGGLFGLN